jgi:transposase
VVVAGWWVGLWWCGWVSGFDSLSRQQLVAVCHAQAEVLSRLERRLDEQGRLIASQVEQIGRLEAEVARLQRRLSRNSGNSSMPPSSDGTLPGTPVPEPKPIPAAKRRRGRQPGAPGAALSWTTPDRVLDHRPGGACRGCGAGLDGAAPAGVVRAWQVTDIPVVTATVTEHRVHAVVCGCGRGTAAQVPPQTPDAPCSYGPNLAALVVYLLVVHALPVARAAGLIADMTGARPSTGHVHSLLGRAAGAMTRPIEAITAGLRRAGVVHFDETTLRVGPAPQRGYVWVAATDLLTLYHVGGRGLSTFTDWDLGRHLSGTVVRDGYAVYDCDTAFDQTRVVHQLCVAHLLRALTDAAEAHPTHTWPTRAADALRGLVHAHHTARNNNLPAIPADTAGPLTTDYRTAVATGLTEIPRRPHGKQQPARSLLECLHELEDDILRFTTDTRIPPTNNQAERDLRPLKTQQKISGRLTSEPTTRDRLTIHAAISTAVKHGHNALATLREAILGNPWIPPIPADP